MAALAAEVRSCRLERARQQQYSSALASRWRFPRRPAAKPQALKARPSFQRLSGTTRVVPFPKPDFFGCKSRLRSYCGGAAGGVVAPGVTWVPITSPETIISTLRFNFRPAAVLLSATGRVLPKPRAITLLIETLLSTR